MQRQKIAALYGTEIGCEVVEITENACVRQPYLRYIRRQTIEVAQTRNAEQAEDDYQQKEKQKDKREVESKRTRLPHSGPVRLVNASTVRTFETIMSCAKMGRLIPRNFCS